MPKAVRGAAKAMKYVAPCMTLFMIYALWIYSRVQSALAALILGALLGAITAIAFAMGKKKFFPSAEKKKKAQLDAARGRMRLLLASKDDAPGILLDAMRHDYPIDDLRVSGGCALGRRNGTSITFGLLRSYGAASDNSALLDFYDRCRADGSDRGVLFLTEEASKSLAELASMLPEPRVTLIPGSKLLPYLARIGEGSDYESPKPSGRLQDVFTKKNGERCMIAAACMIAAHLALGLHWFMPPAMLLAVFAVICRNADKSVSKLF